MPKVVDKTLINDVAGQANAAKTDMAPLYEKFKKLLTGAKMRGQFTVDGKPLNNLSEESYEIEKVEKQAEGDWWVITARIKYGQRDMTFPVPLEVKWAGNTPVMTLDNMTIPGFGTFGARVVFHKDKYAGTWQHDDVGGHMFGVVELASAGAEAGAGILPTTRLCPKTISRFGVSRGCIRIDFNTSWFMRCG